MKKCTYYVDGMHCASCEVLIEKKIKKLEGVKKVDAKLSKNKVEIEFEGKGVEEKEINNLFKENGYAFSSKKIEKNNDPMIKISEGKLILNKSKLKRFALGFFIALFVIALFYILENSKLGGLVSISASSSYPSFFLFGLIAGISSCAALVGGLLLSLSDQWTKQYIDSDSKWKRATPFVMFLIGRTISFAILGGALGVLGKLLNLSISSKPVVTSIIIALVSIYMLCLGLSMLGVHWVDKLQIKLPKFLSRKISDETNFKGKYMPFVVGALTFFLPCGFTINSQALALASGSFLSGMLIMFFFVLGTIPLLLLISFSSVSISQKPKIKAVFEIVAGILVVLFALYNINAQLNVLGLPSLTDLKTRITTSQYTSTIYSDYQLLKTRASSSGYYPEDAVVKANVPIKWEITDDGTTGCTNGIISKQLLGNSQVSLKAGLNGVELPALKPGYYKYSCWMGMYSGVIRAI